MIAYWAVPYLVVAAPPAIVLLTILIGGCTMTRTADDRADRPRHYSDPASPAGKELTSELDRRAARAELRRLIEEAQR
ncbi:hypothetical protein [Bradyrhizobium sp.]|uniref:hypothetical protein n=1 Tax=Bradyrhizobium sp. TaxID=376 RepID=UPI0040379C9C